MSVAWFEVEDNDGIVSASQGGNVIYNHVPLINGDPAALQKGDHLPGVFINGDNQAPVLIGSGFGPLNSGVDLANKQQLPLVPGYWPMYNHDAWRTSQADPGTAPYFYVPGNPPDFVPVVVTDQSHNPITGVLFLRASDSELFVTGKATFNLYDLSNSQLCTPDTIAASQVIYDGFLNCLFILVGGVLGMYNLTSTPVNLHDAYQRGANFGSGVKLEPLLLPATLSSPDAGKTQLWVFDSGTNPLLWNFMRVSKQDASTVDLRVPMLWDGWSKSSQLPNSSRDGSFPICFFDGPYSYLAQIRPYSADHSLGPDPQGCIITGSQIYAAWTATTTYPLNTIVTFQGALYQCVLTPNLNKPPSSTQGTFYWLNYSEGGRQMGLGNYIIPCANDPDFLSAAWAEYSSPRSYEGNTPHNYSRIPSRSQALCVDPRVPDTHGNATRIWDRHSWTATAGSTTFQTYTPLCISADKLVVHVEESKFGVSPQFCTQVIVNNEGIDALPDANPQVYGLRVWPTFLPAPPWAWKPQTVLNGILADVQNFKPTLGATYTRDVQTSVAHHLEVWNANTGTTLQSMAFPTSSTTPPVTKQYFDTGDPLCTLHSSAGKSHGPFRMIDTSVTLKTGLDNGSATSLRQLLGIANTEYYPVCFFAMETFSCNSWGSEDHPYQYRAGNIDGQYFDTRSSDSVPALTGAVGGDGRALHAWITNPFKNQTNVTTDQLNANQILGGEGIAWGEYQQSGVMYQGYARHCAGRDPNTGITFVDSPLGAVHGYDPYMPLRHDTISYLYYAWCVKLLPAQMPAPAFDEGYDCYNMATDGHYAVLAPRVPRGRTSTPPTSNQPPDWMPVVNNFPPKQNDTNAWYLGVNSVTPTMLGFDVNSGALVWQKQFPGVTVTAPPSMAIWNGVLYMIMEGVLYNMSAARGTIQAQVAMPGLPANWRGADLIVTPGQVNIGATGGLVEVPLIVVLKQGPTGPSGPGVPYTVADITGLTGPTGAISTNASVAETTAKQHNQTHSVFDHPDIDKSAVPLDVNGKPTIHAAMVATSNYTYKLQDISQVAQNSTVTGVGGGKC